MNAIEYTDNPATVADIPINHTPAVTPPPPDLGEVKLNSLLLVSVHVRAWQASVKDKKLTAEAESQSGAAKGRVRVQKCLMNTSRLRRVRSVGDAQRDEIIPRYSTATPIKGLRAMRVSFYPKLTDDWNAGMATYEQALNEFLSYYDTDVLEQVRELQGAYDPEEYPSLEEMRAKFSVDLNVQPLTDPSQLTGFADEIIEQVSDTYTRMVAAGTRDVWKRSLDLVSNLATSLATAERLSQSHWDRLNEFTIDAPGLMPEADEEFNRHMADIREVLLAAPKDLVRESPAVRETATAAVRHKLDQLKSKYQDVL